MADRHALFLTHEPPLPMISGTRVRSLNLMRELRRRGWRVSLFGLTPAGGVATRDRLALDEICETVTLEPLPSAGRRRLAVAGAVLRGRAFQSTYFFSASAAARLRETLAAGLPDVIVAEQLYMYPYLPPELRGISVLDCHNVELRRIETMAAALWPRPRGLVARLQGPAVRRFERQAVTSVAGVLAVSEPERHQFDSLAPGRVSLVPNGVDCERWRPRAAPPATPTFLFAGSLDYSANLDAVRYLVNEIVPAVGRRDAELTIVGGNPPPGLRKELARSSLAIELTGLVPDTEPYFARSRFLAVPLRFGAGTPLKILEALARGVPVLSTSSACEGLELRPGRDIMVADEPREFAASIDRLLGDDELCLTLARNGRAVAERVYDWRRIGAGLERALSEVASS